MPTLRVMTYNIQGLRRGAGEVAGVLQDCGPDVVAVQEPPRGPLGRRRLRRVARAAGLEPAVSGGGARTTALLVRAGLATSPGRAVRLPWRPGRTRRGLAVGDVAGVRVISVHLGLDAGERARHLDRLLSVVGAGPRPCVVAGDLNERPGGACRQRLGRHLSEVTAGLGPTFSTDRPRWQIDVVLASEGVTATGPQVVDSERTRRASDHFPVVVDLALDGDHPDHDAGSGARSARGAAPAADPANPGDAR